MSWDRKSIAARTTDELTPGPQLAGLKADFCSESRGLGQVEAWCLVWGSHRAGWGAHEPDHKTDGLASSPQASLVAQRVKNLPAMQEAPV